MIDIEQPARKSGPAIPATSNAGCLADPRLRR
jgi:hypothetical protein